MRGQWQFVEKLFSTQEEGTSLALFRIGLGLTTLYALLSIAFAGLLGPLWTHVDHGGMSAVTGNWLVQLLGGATPGVVWGLWWTALAATLAFTLGVGGPIVGRLICLLVLQSYNALVTINPYTMGGYDMLMTNGMWILFLAEPTATLSVHARMRHGSFFSRTLVSAWPRYVLIAQLLMLYSLTGLQKTGVVWSPGGGYSALYWVTQDQTWMRFDGELAAWMTLVLQVVTAITWHWEQFSILLLLWFYYRYTSERPGAFRAWILKYDWRTLWAKVGIPLHVAILVLLNVGAFSLVVLSFYVLFWRPDEWEQGYLRISKRLSRTPASES